MQNYKNIPAMKIDYAGILKNGKLSDNAGNFNKFYACSLVDLNDANFQSTVFIQDPVRMNTFGGSA